MRSQGKRRRILQLACIITAALFSCAFLFSPEDNDRFLVERAYSDSKGAVHILDHGGDRTIPKEKDQVGASFIKVAEDRQTVGWAVEFDNCCTSYPIPLGLVIYKEGKVRQRLNRGGQMIYDWNFLSSGREVAFCTGTVHGNSGTKCELHDAKTGRVLATYFGRPGTKTPGWIKGIKH
jgi:hypothetical protein